MARKTTPTRVTETEAKDERNEIRKGLNDAEAPTRAEISADTPIEPDNPQGPPRRRGSRERP
jgi:hypothetical protein